MTLGRIDRVRLVLTTGLVAAAIYTVATGSFNLLTEADLSLLTSSLCLHGPPGS